MKTITVSILAIFLVLAQAASSHAALCAACSDKFFDSSVGACKVCKGTTSSGAFKLCKKCSEKLAQCEACQRELKPATETQPAKEKTAPAPAAALTSPNGKAYPAHWGAPPRIQTRDYRPLPGGYGNGSGTLATWIQKNLDQDAKASIDPEKKKPEAGNAEEIRRIEEKIAAMEDLATRARFTAEGFKKHQADLAALRERLKALKGEAKPSAN